MKDKFLPIGSVVLLKGAKKRIMITGFCMADKNDIQKKYDYCGCMFPEGIIDTNHTALFNHDQIEKIFFAGIQDAEVTQFMDRLKTAVNNAKNNEQVTNS